MSTLPLRNARFEAFVAPARQRPALWRLAAGLALAATFWLTAAALLLRSPAAAARAPMLPGLYLLSFAALIAGLALAARFLHGRGIASLIGPGGLSWRAWLAGAGVVAAAGIVFGVPGWLLAPPQQQVAPLIWARWLPAALVLVLVQTAAEELAFRGYMMQQLAARFRSAAIWLFAPALLFGALHWNPGEYGPNAWLVALAAAVMGLILGDVTARTGNLSAAMGLHFANNTLALLVVAMPSPMSSLSLFLSGIGPGDVVRLRQLLLLDIAASLAAYGLWLLWWHRRSRLHSEGADSI